MIINFEKSFKIIINNDFISQDFSTHVFIKCMKTPYILKHEFINLAMRCVHDIWINVRFFSKINIINRINNDNQI